MLDKSKDLEKMPGADSLRCIRCRYALQGLDRYADCPECGLAIELSRTRLYAVTSRALFMIAIRIIAIVTLTQSMNLNSEYFYDLVDLLLHYGSYGIADALKLFVPFIFVLVMATVLWVMAPKLAKLGIPDDVPLLANCGGPKSLLLIGLCLFALWISLSGAQDILITLLGVYGDIWVMSHVSYRHDENGARLFMAIGCFKLALGIVMFYLYRLKWKALLRRRGS